MEQYLPACLRYGMTEEQFWRSNPRIIKVYEKAWREEENRKNELTYAYVGNYFLSAMTVSVDHCLNGKKAKSEYLSKPIQIFELTEEEKEIERQKAISQFMGWTKNVAKKYSEKGG